MDIAQHSKIFRNRETSRFLLNAYLLMMNRANAIISPQMRGLISSFQNDIDVTSKTFLYKRVYDTIKLINSVIVHAQAMASIVLRKNAAMINPVTVVTVFLTPKKNCILVLLHTRHMAPEVDNIICNGSDNAKILNTGIAASHFEP